MGADTTVTTDSNGNDIIRINAPEISTEKSCDTCARRETCTKVIGVIWGYCVTDYKPIERANQ